jgi:catalase
MPHGPAAVRNMALSFRPPDGEESRMAMIDIPVFIVKNPKGFHERWLASQPGPRDRKTGPSENEGFCRPPS